MRKLGLCAEIFQPHSHKSTVYAAQKISDDKV